MRIGIFGGTFNPIHVGHLKAAREVHHHFQLDRTCLVPVAIPPHKEYRVVAGAADRLAMIRLAISDDPGFTVSDVELKRAGPSYTIDTITHFISSTPENTEVFLILGMDAFLEIDTWKRYMELLETVDVIVIDRPGPQSGNQFMALLSSVLKTRISTDYSRLTSQNRFIHPNGRQVIPFRGSFLDISSTEIRQRLKEKKSIEGLVPIKVDVYLKDKGLYV